jgi:hypothetical protein
MTVDFPEPDGPTKAVVLPASKTSLKSFKTVISGLEGYLNVTFLNSIKP